MILLLNGKDNLIQFFNENQFNDGISNYLKGKK